MFGVRAHARRLLADAHEAPAGPEVHAAAAPPASAHDRFLLRAGNDRVPLVPLSPTDCGYVLRRLHIVLIYLLRRLQ